MLTFFGQFISYPYIIPLTTVKYESAVGLLEQGLSPPEPDPLPLPVLLPPFIPKSAFSSKLPSFRERRDQVEISVDTYPSAHEDPTMMRRVLVSLKEISLLPVPVTPF